MKKFLFPILALFIAALLISSCRSSAVVVRERPNPPHYVHPAAPGPNYVWVDGRWIKSRKGYIYHKGYWVVPRRNHHYYVSGHWQRRGKGWVWLNGHWR